MVLSQLPIFVVGLLVALFVVVSVMMMLIVLIQRPQGGGLSEAFGSASGSGHTAFGARTGDALTYATIVIFVVFLLFGVGLNYIVRPPRALSPLGAIGSPTAPAVPVQGTPAPASTPAAPAEPPPQSSDTPSTPPAESPTQTTPPEQPAEPPPEEDKPQTPPETP